eukprot:827762-Rhodomonas_salina.1
MKGIGMRAKVTLSMTSSTLKSSSSVCTTTTASWYPKPRVSIHVEVQNNPILSDQRIERWAGGRGADRNRRLIHVGEDDTRQLCHFVLPQPRLASAQHALVGPGPTMSTCKCSSITASRRTREERVAHLSAERHKAGVV